MDKLYGSDYIRLPILDLVSHEDYDQEARDVIIKVLLMDTASLKELAVHIRNMEEDSNE